MFTINIVLVSIFVKKEDTNGSLSDKPSIYTASTTEAYCLPRRKKPPP